MSALGAAVRQEQWDVTAYLLLIGLAKVASRLPPEALGELLDLLAAEHSAAVPAFSAPGAHRHARGRQ